MSKIRLTPSRGIQPQIATSRKLNPSLQSLLASPSRITATGRLKLDPQGNNKKSPLSAPPIPTLALTGSLPITWVEERKASAIQIQDPERVASQVALSSQVAENPSRFIIQNPGTNVDILLGQLAEYPQVTTLFNKVTLIGTSPAGNPNAATNGFYYELDKEGKQQLKSFVNLYADKIVPNGRFGFLQALLDEAGDNRTAVMVGEEFGKAVGEKANYMTQSINNPLSYAGAVLDKTGNIDEAARQFASRLPGAVKQYGLINPLFVLDQFPSKEVAEATRKSKETVFQLFSFTEIRLTADLNGIWPQKTYKTTATSGPDVFTLTQDNLINGGALDVNGGRGDDTFILSGIKSNLSGEPLRGGKGNDLFLASLEEGGWLNVNGDGGNNSTVGIIPPGAYLRAEKMSKVTVIGLPSGMGLLEVSRGTQIDVINSNKTVESLVAAGNIHYS
jgi:hypothetical protein